MGYTEHEVKDYFEEVNFLDEIARRTKNPDALTKFIMEKGLWKVLDIGSLPGEIWEPIPLYEGLYELSTYSRIKCLPKWRGAFFMGERIFKQKVTTAGYLGVSLSKDNKKSWPHVHRLVGFVSIPNPENKPGINHINFCKIDNRCINLEWNTQLENERYTRQSGRKNWEGEGHPMAKITDQQVEEIKELYRSQKHNQVQLAKMYLVTQATISRILLNKRKKTVLYGVH